jgi:hypothetical protein
LVSGQIERFGLSLDAGVSVNGEDVSVTEDDFSVLKLVVSH